jgi:hypothetical protein
MAVVGAVAAALLAGTFLGDDDNFPFGPFRMYSVANRLDGTIQALKVEATTVGGREIDVTFDAIGLRRAEVEGQLRFMSPEQVVPHLAAAFEERNPDGPAIGELRLIRANTRLERGRIAEYSEETLATWTGS